MHNDRHYGCNSVGAGDHGFSRPLTPGSWNLDGRARNSTGLQEHWPQLGFILYFFAKFEQFRAAATKDRPPSTTKLAMYTMRSRSSDIESATWAPNAAPTTLPTVTAPRHTRDSTAGSNELASMQPGADGRAWV